MSYHIYTTRGIILSSRPIGEADRIYSVLTRDLGLVRARAAGVRKNISKLRGVLEPFVLSRISLVRGKDYWRVTSAECLRAIPAAAGIARPLALLEKLVQGEAHHPELFDAVEDEITRFKIQDSGFKNEDWEISLVSKVLHHLGYLKEADLNLDKKELIKVINEGLQSSHLV
ncbi:MAG: recombination protein O N-terminal domain-containing protein [Candidatus Zambryskibacteria bacterium]|nr:recombination protein O N-terminal domain-containing protein [Candidatus Zambryskibacteria bacterium]